MTKKQIMQAWSKSSSTQQLTHKQFDEKMCQKTIVNSGCNMIINSTPEYQMGMDEETNMIENKLPDHEVVDEQPYNEPTDFVEVEEVEEVKVVEPVKVEKVVEEPIALAKPPKVEDLNSDFDF